MYKAISIINGKPTSKVCSTLDACFDEMNSPFEELEKTTSQAELRKSDLKAVFYIQRIADNVILFNVSLNFLGSKIKAEEFQKE